MQRKILYKCEQCGTEFGNKLECEQHERTCKNKQYLIANLKARIKAYLQRIEQKGFGISISYDTTANRCLIAIVDLERLKKRKK